ncbi:FliM/FliN family flagellar motor C-terminal domain-containing protein [uncultured Roseovarius sp.]|uniref:FliM/FliN family flagellar motor C-terminal domain-containing protein n=1 Tax=uncultured Roseovarius sp. TaxID=293344 RepID=UPI002617E33A|nr:FliM/FliN family flagellar motor C-terminal domain-containing protein [uncultured Roseovarius sp.]
MALAMGSQDHGSVIQRMAQAARGGFDSRQMSPAKALRLALARVADSLFGLGITVATVEQMRLPLAEVAQHVSDEGLLVHLDGAAGTRGALCLDPQFLAGLIEVQTTGAVRPAVARPRAATRTDAAMVAPLIDAVMAEFDSQMTAEVEGYLARGFSFGDLVEDMRALSLVLLAPDYDLLQLTVDLGPGAKTGRLDLLLPVVPLPVRAAPGVGALGDGSAPLDQVVRTAPVVLDAVMGRLRLPLRDVWAFKPGDLVPIPREALGETQLVGTKGHIVAIAQLGQMNGWRALRLIAGGAAPLPDRPDPEDETATQVPVASAASASPPRTGRDLVSLSDAGQSREPV